MTLYGFETALRYMKEGISMRRLSWERGPKLRRKTKVAISPEGVIRTWYLNYHSDRGVLSTDDILANDWVVAE